MVIQALDDGDEVVIVVTERGGAREYSDAALVCERLRLRARPLMPRPTVYIDRAVPKAAAGLGPFVHQHHLRAGRRRPLRGYESGGPGADDEHVAVCAWRRVYRSGSASLGACPRPAARRMTCS